MSENSNLKNKIEDNYKKARTFFKETYNKHIIYMYIVISLIVAFVIEVAAEKSLWKALKFSLGSPYIYLCNVLIILMSLSFTLLIKRRFFAMSLISVVWLVLGTVNGIMLIIRVTPLTFSDLLMINEGIRVADKYFSIWHAILATIIVVLIVVALIYMFRKMPKVNHPIKYIRNIIGIGIIWLIGLGMITIAIRSGVIEKNFGNLRDCYSQYGFVYCFSNSVFNTGVSKPDSYSDETIKEITKGEGVGQATNTPNIIFVQLESFFDINNMKDIKVNKNPVPNFEKYLKECASGYFNVPVVGAGTVNTEFEVMTGMNMDSFGPGEYPFRTVLQDNTCESICYNLKKHNYTAHAIHNNTATFYTRHRVFANLGYDDFTSIETMDAKDYTESGWAKDKILTKYIMDALNTSSGKDFIYTISVQGHGSYPTDDVKYPFTVSGLGDKEREKQFEYYAQQTNEMDQFIGDLIDNLSNYDEDVVLVMYGDHLPSLGITAEELVNENVYQTQYFIWTNFNSKYEKEDLEAYKLQSKILQMFNIKDGNINNYIQTYDGTDDAEFQEGLQNLEYDQLYGEFLENDGVNPYEPTELKFGLHTINISAITPINNKNHSVYVYGKYFTPNCTVFINDEKIDTEYIDGNTIKFSYEDLKDGDMIKVALLANDGYELYSTPEFEYKSEN